MTKITLLSLAVAVLASGAFAHSGVEKTTPGNGATVQAVETIELRFDDPMRVTAISMTGPSGTVEIMRETGMDAVVEFKAKPADKLPAGNYSVEWRGLSADGHPMQGSFDFTVEE